MTGDSTPTFYSIHDIITIQANTSIPVPDRFRVPESAVEELNLVVEEGDIDIPLDRRAMTRSGMFFFGSTDGSVFIDYMTPVVDTVLEISDIEGRTAMRYTPSFERFGNVNVLFQTLLQFKLIQQGYTFVHAGCVQTEGSCKLVVGMRNTGKTSTILSLTDGEETLFLSDDLTIIDSSGVAYCYPTPLEVSPFTLTGDLFTYEGDRLQTWLARHQITSLVIQEYLGHELSEQKHVPDWAIADTGGVDQVFILDGNGPPEHERIPADEAANRVLMATAELLDPFRIYSLNFLSFYLDYSTADLFSTQREILASALDSMRCFALNAPDGGEYASMIEQLH